MTKPLFLGRSTCVGFNSNEKPSLEIGEHVEVEKQVVDLILSNDVVGLDLSLIVLCLFAIERGNVVFLDWKRVSSAIQRFGPKRRIREREGGEGRGETYLKDFEILYILAFTVEDFSYDHGTIIVWSGCDGSEFSFGRVEENSVLFEPVEQFGDRVNHLRA